MNGEGAAGRFDDDIGYLRGDLVTGWETYSASPFGYFPDVSMGSITLPKLDFSAFNQGTGVSVVDPSARADTAFRLSKEAIPSGAPEVVITGEPPLDTGESYWEDGLEYSTEDPHKYETGGSEPDWDEVFRQFKCINDGGDAICPEFVEEGFDVAIDWGDIAGTVVEGYFNSQTTALAPQYAQGVLQRAPGAVMPATVTVDTRTGKVTACKRRRRRRLLTEGDFNDLMRIATLPNKDTVKVALAKAVGRR